MRLHPTPDGFVIDAADLGPLLGLDPGDVARLMRDGRITHVSEAGEGEDAGRYRVTFRHGSTRLRLTLDQSGAVLSRTRTSIAPGASTRAAADHRTPRKPRDQHETPANG